MYNASKPRIEKSAAKKPLAKKPITEKLPAKKTTTEQSMSDKFAAIKHPLQELIDTEERFRKSLTIQQTKIREFKSRSIPRLFKKSTLKEIAKLIKPYEALEKTAALKYPQEPKILDSLATKYHEVIPKICDDLLTHVQNNFEWFLDATLEGDELSAISTKEKIFKMKIKDFPVPDPSTVPIQLTILPPQRFMRYPLTLAEVLKQFDKKFPDIAKKPNAAEKPSAAEETQATEKPLVETRKKMVETLEKVKKITDLLNEVEGQKNELKVFNSNTNTMAVGQILIRYGIFNDKENKKFIDRKDLKELKKATIEIANAIIYLSTEEIEKIFKKYSIKVSNDKIDAIKQEYYKNQLDPKFAQMILAVSVKLQLNTKEQKFKGTTEASEYIKGINKSFDNLQKGMFKNVEVEFNNINKNLTNLGYNDEQKKETMEYIKQGLIEHIKNGLFKKLTPQKLEQLKKEIGMEPKDKLKSAPQLKL